MRGVLNIKKLEGKTMKCCKTVKCPCYDGDGYLYEFKGIEFLFCVKCNNTLFIQMSEQKKLEKKC